MKNQKGLIFPKINYKLLKVNGNVDLILKVDISYRNIA